MLMGSVMEAASGDFQSLCNSATRYSIDQPVFTVDPPRPPAAHIVLEWLGFANAFERMAHALAYQPVDALKKLTIPGLIFEILAPTPRGKYKDQGSINSRTWPFPASSSAIASARMAAFLGEERR